MRKKIPEENEERELDFFSKYLSVRVAIRIIPGTAIGYVFPGFADTLRGNELANASIPVAVLLLIMIFTPPWESFSSESQLTSQFLP